MRSGRLNPVHRSHGSRPGRCDERRGERLTRSNASRRAGYCLHELQHRQSSADIFNIADRCIAIDAVLFFLETCHLRC